MKTIIKRIIFILILIFLILINYKLNNIFGNGYIYFIKYFFVGLGLLFIIFPNIDKDYSKIKSNIIS